jgi:hypothetical protein
MSYKLHTVLIMTDPPITYVSYVNHDALGKEWTQTRNRPVPHVREWIVSNVTTTSRWYHVIRVTRILINNNVDLCLCSSAGNCSNHFINLGWTVLTIYTHLSCVHRSADIIYWLINCHHGVDHSYCGEPFCFKNEIFVIAYCHQRWWANGVLVTLASITVSIDCNAAYAIHTHNTSCRGPDVHVRNWAANSWIVICGFEPWPMSGTLVIMHRACPDDRLAQFSLIYMHI